ncbi:MAG: alpha/beta fold hydrolase [Acidimicrobiia bacterium]
MLLHGSGRSHTDWLAVADRLAANRRVIAIDLYGCGRSDRRDHYRYGYQLWSEQAVQLMDHLGIQHATIVGHSLGGIIACLTAARHPDRAQTVITVGTGLAIDPMLIPLALPGIGELILARRGVDDHTPTPQQRYERETAYRIPGTRSALLRYTRRQLVVDGPILLRGAIDDLPVPALHVSGTLDRNINTAATRRLAGRTGGTVVIWPHAHHYSLIETPEWLIDLINSSVTR